MGKFRIGSDNRDELILTSAERLTTASFLKPDQCNTTQANFTWLFSVENITPGFIPAASLHVFWVNEHTKACDIAKHPAHKVT